MERLYKFSRFCKAILVSYFPNILYDNIVLPLGYKSTILFWYYISTNTLSAFSLYSLPSFLHSFNHCYIQYTERLLSEPKKKYTLHEESLLLTKVYLVVRQNVSWLIQSSVTTHIHIYQHSTCQLSGPPTILLRVLRGLFSQ